MKSFPPQWAGCIVLLCAWCGVADRCSAAFDETALVQFWKTNAILNGSSEKYKAQLQSLGVADANLLSRFLLLEEVRAETLYSMALLAETSKPLEFDTLEKVVSFTTNASVGLDVQKQALRLLLSYYPREPGIQRFVDGDLSRFWFGDGQSRLETPAARRSAQLSAECLFQLGEYAAKTGSAGIRAYLRPAQSILSVKVAASQEGGSAMPVPSDDTNSLHTLLMSMKWPLYQHANLSQGCARVFIGYLRRTQSLPVHIHRSDVKPAIDFLLHESRANPDYLAEKISGLCSDDPRLASIVLWTLNESKDSPVAKKALEIINSGEKNQDLLRAIQSGQSSREEAFEKPLNEIYNKTVR